jgi:hypothetical protein
MDRQCFGQEPQLGRYRRDAVVVIEPEDREEELAPRYRRERAATRQEPGPEARVACGEPQEKQRDVVQHRREHVRVALDVEALTAVGILMVGQYANMPASVV